MTISSFLYAKTIVEEPTCLKFVLYQSICIKCHSAEFDMTNVVCTLCLTQYDPPPPHPLHFEKSWLRPCAGVWLWDRSVPKENGLESKTQQRKPLDGRNLIVNPKKFQWNFIQRSKQRSVVEDRQFGECCSNEDDGYAVIKSRKHENVLKYT